MTWLVYCFSPLHRRSYDLGMFEHPSDADDKIRDLYTKYGDEALVGHAESDVSAEPALILSDCRTVTSRYQWQPRVKAPESGSPMERATARTKRETAESARTFGAAVEHGISMVQITPQTYMVFQRTSSMGRSGVDTSQGWVMIPVASSRPLIKKPVRHAVAYQIMCRAICQAIGLEYTGDKNDPIDESLMVGNDD